LTGEVLDKFAQLIATALGLVAALAWNTAIQSLFTRLFGEAGAALIGQFAYAVLITLIVGFFMSLLEVRRRWHAGALRPYALASRLSLIR
jgi:hypothetical protein